MPRWYPTRELARPVYYDRDAIPIIATYVGLVTPHTFTTRATYTPAFPFAAFIEVLMTFAFRVTAATTPSAVSSFWDFLPFYGGTARLDWNYFEANTAGYQLVHQLTSFGYMAYGDTIRYTTNDSSTGGTIYFLGSMKGTEFYY